jgi:GxxExxY protein
MPFDDEPTPYDDRREPPAALDELAHRVIEAAIEVHRELGPGLPEEAYERAMSIELTARGMSSEKQRVVEIFYKGAPVGRGRIDLLVEGALIVEIKSIDSLSSVHRLQVLSYMRMLKQPLALLINFNVAVLKDGIRRVVLT